MLTRLDPATPQTVRKHIDHLCEGIDNLCTILDGIPVGDPREALIVDAIDVLYLDATSLFEEWDQPCEAQIRDAAKPGKKNA